MACVLSRATPIASFKDYPFLKTSKKTFYPTATLHSKKVIGLGNITYLSISSKSFKRRQFSISSCMKDGIPESKAAVFPSQKWFTEKAAGVFLEIAKAFILWISGWLYQKRLFNDNLPFTKGDLVQLKVNDDLLCGVVEKIGDTKTSIRGLDGFLYFVPNSDVETKSIKTLTLVTRKANVKVNAEKTKVDAAQASEEEDRELRLWGVTFSVQISFESYVSMDEKIKEIRKFITTEKYVEQKERIMVSVESYLPDKKAFKILVGFFVDAHENIDDYSEIKLHFQTKLEEMVKIN